MSGVIVVVLENFIGLTPLMNDGLKSCLVVKKAREQGPDSLALSDAEPHWIGCQLKLTQSAHGVRVILGVRNLLLTANWRWMDSGRFQRLQSQ
jgi:hypothetical protein